MSQPNDQDIIHILGQAHLSTTQLCDRLRDLFARSSTRFAHTGEPSLRSIIGQAMGFASVCWSEIENAGEFDSAAASTAVQTAVDDVRNLIHTRLVGLLDEAGTAKEWNDAIEAALKALEEL